MISDSFFEGLENATPVNPYTLDLPTGLEGIELRFSNLSYQTIEDTVRRHSSDIQIDLSSLLGKLQELDDAQRTMVCANAKCGKSFDSYDFTITIEEAIDNNKRIH